MVDFEASPTRECAAQPRKIGGRPCRVLPELGSEDPMGRANALQTNCRGRR